MSKDCMAAFIEELTRNPLVKGEGIVWLKVPLPLVYTQAKRVPWSTILHLAQPTSKVTWYDILSIFPNWSLPPRLLATILTHKVNKMSTRAWTLSIEDREKLIKAAFQGSVILLSCNFPPTFPLGQRRKETIAVTPTFLLGLLFLPQMAPSLKGPISKMHHMVRHS